MSDLPWFAPGLKFRCTGCGNCCTGGPGVVWVTDEELAEIARLRKLPLGQLKLFDIRIIGGRMSLREYANGDCIYFDPQKRNCTVYEARPTQCRTWPFWPSNLQDESTWDRVATRCPGTGTGDFIPWEQVAQQAAACNI